MYKQWCQTSKTIILHVYSTCDKLSDSNLVLLPPSISRHFWWGTNVGG